MQGTQCQLLIIKYQQAGAELGQAQLELGLGFMIYLPVWDGSFLCSATPSYPCHQKSPSRLSTSYPLTIYMVNFKLDLYFPGGGSEGGWVEVVITESKANLSSTSHLTSQLELSLAKTSDGTFK